jgi:hypothetical protein
VFIAVTTTSANVSQLVILSLKTCLKFCAYYGRKTLGNNTRGLTALLRRNLRRSYIYLSNTSGMSFENGIRGRRLLAK